MHQVLADAEHHLQFKFLEKIHHFRTLSLCSKVRSNEYSFLKINYQISKNIKYSIKKAPRISRGFLYSIKLGYALLALCFFAFGSEPNGLFLAKSTNTGAATKIEE